MPKLQVGIFGIGAIGSVVGCALLRNDNLQLYFFNRSHITKLRVSQDEFLCDYRIHMSNSETDTPELDYLIITLKEHHYLAAHSHLKKLISHKTLVFVLRNGLKLKESVSGIVQDENVRECIIDCAVQPNPKGGYTQFSNLKITVGSSHHATELQDLFLQVADVITVQDFHSALWKKLCLSSSIGGLLCMANDTCVIFQTPVMLKKFKFLLEESIAIAKKDGAEIEDDFVRKSVRKVLGYPHSKGSSMLTDMRSGKQVELGAKNGAIQAAAKSLYMLSPLNDEVCSYIMSLNVQA